MSTPQAVLDVLDKLDAGDRETVQSYITELQTKLQGFHGDDEEAPAQAAADTEMPDAASAEEEDTATDEPAFPPIYSSGEDYDKAAECKQEAADAKASGDWDKALELYTQAVLLAPPSALLYANRANALLKLGRYRAAVRDCDLALKENPDSAKALRMRGKARKELGEWEAALKDLSASQTIDFDEGTVEDLKFLTEKHIETEKVEAKQRNEEEEKLKRRAEEIRKAQKEAKREAAKGAAKSSGMPGGMPGGMDGLMGALMSDPELIAAMQNPKVQAALQDLMGGPGGAAGLMSNPGKVQELMSDPEVGPVLKKIFDKLGAKMGMPGAGGAAAGAAGDDDIPNLDDLDDGGVDLDDLPDLE